MSGTSPPFAVSTGSPEDRPLAVRQHHRVPRIQARPEVEPGLRALVKRVGERRDAPGQLDRGRRGRSGPLRNHVDSLSRVASAAGPEVLTQPLLLFPGRLPLPAVMAAYGQARSRPPVPAACQLPEVTAGTVLHVHHSPV
jgi:hypothetical protein